jgi:hypothetical protein
MPPDAATHTSSLRPSPAACAFSPHAAAAKHNRPEHPHLIQVLLIISAVIAITIANATIVAPLKGRGSDPSTAAQQLAQQTTPIIAREPAEVCLAMCRNSIASSHTSPLRQAHVDDITRLQQEVESYQYKDQLSDKGM